MALYNNAIEQAKAESKTISVKVVRLATVTSLTANGKPKVTFFGDTAESSKEYSYLEGYIPEVGDVVAMIPQADTWIILGHVASGKPKDEAPFPSKDDMKTDTITDGTNSLTLASGVLSPNANQSVQFGTASKKMGDGYFKSLYIGTAPVRANAAATISTGTGSATLKMDDNSVMTPSTTNVQIGTASSYIGKIYVKEVTLCGTVSYNPSVTLNAASLPATSLHNPGYADSEMVYDSLVFKPKVSKKISLGSNSYQFNAIYGNQIYQNGSSITTSDRRKKKSIKSVAKKYIDFFKALRPVTFKYRDGESGRTHAGFIAQEVEEAMKSCGIDNADFAALVIQEDGSYGLRYEEFIALQTKVIQNLLERVDTLERRLTDGQ